MAAVVSLLAAVHAAPPPHDGKPEPAVFIEKLRAGREQTIVYYGTSLTQAGAWTRFLTEELTAKFPGQVTARNSGGPGMHSGWGLRNVDERVIAHKPDVVFIEFAINDAGRHNKSRPFFAGPTTVDPLSISIRTVYNGPRRWTEATANRFREVR